MGTKITMLEILLIIYGFCTVGLPPEDTMYLQTSSGQITECHNIYSLV
jgi:hypothetical protein